MKPLLGSLPDKGLLVVKVGSSLLIDHDGGLRRTWMQILVDRLARRSGSAVLVSSGAIALGRGALGLDARPRLLAQAQAAAAVGQIHLAAAWSEYWRAEGRVAAQILLTLGDLEQRRRYLNARATLETLIENGIVPVVNENDTVATEEIRFGDNDRLAARVAQLLAADQLLLLSDVDGLYTADPASDAGASHLAEVEAITPAIEAMASGAGRRGVGTGGMASKLQAARIATEAGIPVVLACGLGDDPLGELAHGARATRFLAQSLPRASRKQWLRGLQQPAGRLDLDAGAVEALRSGASLLAVGVQAVIGEFDRGDLITLIGPDGIVGQGLCAYSATHARLVVGQHSAEVARRLANANRGPVVHRDDLVLF